MLCFFATAYASICKMLLLKRNTTALNTACSLFEFFLTFTVTAPHRLDKSALLFAKGDKFIICGSNVSFLLHIFEGSFIHSIVNVL